MGILKVFNETVSNIGGELGINESYTQRQQRHEREQQQRIQGAYDAQKREEHQAKLRAVEQKERKATLAGYDKAAALSSEQVGLMADVEKKSMGVDLMSAQLAEKQRKETERQQNTLAMLRGYDPSASRAAQRGIAQSQQLIGQQEELAAAEEQAAAQRDLAEMTQYQQQMAFTGEQAKKNYLMGNRELAEQQSASLMNYRAALAEIDSRRKMAEAARKNALTNALLSAGAGIVATVATGGNVGAGMAASTATGAILSQRK
jgi:hypothetical protein